VGAHFDYHTVLSVVKEGRSTHKAINPLVAFCDIHGGERGAILLFCLGHHTRRVHFIKGAMFSCNQNLNYYLY
jgi:hypothetical protein